MSHPIHLILSSGTRIKRGERPWPDVNAWRLRLHKEFDEAFASTQLPERPDYAWANKFLLKARRQQVESACRSNFFGNQV